MAQGNKDKDVLLRAFDSARAWSSLLVTLAMGGIVFTAVFRGEFVGSENAVDFKGWLMTTWILFGVSLMMGAVYLGSITAKLSAGNPSNLDVYGSSIRWSGVLQMLTFGFGVAFFIVFAAGNLF